MYLDATNLFGPIISQPLATGNFQLISTEEPYKIYVLTIDDDSNFGYVFEIDIEYYADLDNFHQELLFLPENKSLPNS